MFITIPTIFCPSKVKTAWLTCSKINNDQNNFPAHTENQDLFKYSEDAYITIPRDRRVEKTILNGPLGRHVMQRRRPAEHPPIFGSVKRSIYYSSGRYRHIALRVLLLAPCYVQSKKRCVAHGLHYSKTGSRAERFSGIRQSLDDDVCCLFREATQRVLRYGSCEWILVSKESFQLLIEPWWGIRTTRIFEKQLSKWLAIWLHFRFRLMSPVRKCPALGKSSNRFQS